MIKNEQILEQLAYAGNEKPRLSTPLKAQVTRYRAWHISLATLSQMAWILDPLPRRPIRCGHLRKLCSTRKARERTLRACRSTSNKLQ